MEVLVCPGGARRAGELVCAGMVVVFPTDTVYGVGCDPYRQDAVDRVYRIKRRDRDKRVPVLARSKKDLEKIARFGNTAERLAQRFWPGALTLILECVDARIGRALRTQTLAVRVPGDPCVMGMLEHCRMVIGTSANAAGTRPARDPSEINIAGFDALLDGGRRNSIGSTIVDLTGAPRMVREGVLSREVQKLF